MVYHTSMGPDQMARANLIRHYNDTIGHRNRQRAAGQLLDGRREQYIATQEEANHLRDIVHVLNPHGEHINRYAHSNEYMPLSRDEKFFHDERAQIFLDYMNSKPEVQRALDSNYAFNTEDASVLTIEQIDEEHLMEMERIRAEHGNVDEILLSNETEFERQKARLEALLNTFRQDQFLRNFAGSRFPKDKLKIPTRSDEAPSQVGVVTLAQRIQAGITRNQTLEQTPAQAAAGARGQSVLGQGRRTI